MSEVELKVTLEEAVAIVNLLGVSYSKLITPMLKMIQQQAAIAALEAKVAALENK